MWDIVIIPGNPGIAAGYTHYAKSLWEMLEGRAQIEVLGYLGHSEQDLGVNRWFSFQDQLEHVVTYLNTTRGPDAKIRVIGHSIGAYMALHALDKLGPTRVTRVVGLMPFLQLNHASRVQRFLNALVHVAPLVQIVAAAIGISRWLPSALRNQLFAPVIRLLGGTEPEWLVLAMRWLRRWSVLNWALLGKTEFDHFGSRDPENMVRRHASCLAFLHTDGDFWAPVWQHDEFQARMPSDMQLLLTPGTMHSFVMRKNDTELIAKKTIGMLQGL